MWTVAAIVTVCISTIPGQNAQASPRGAGAITRAVGRLGSSVPRGDQYLGLREAKPTCKASVRDQSRLTDAKGTSAVPASASGAGKAAATAKPPEFDQLMCDLWTFNALSQMFIVQGAEHNAEVEQEEYENCLENAAFFNEDPGPYCAADLQDYEHAAAVLDIEANLYYLYAVEAWYWCDQGGWT